MKLLGKRYELMLILVLFALLSGCRQKQEINVEAAQRDIRLVLDASVDAWNRGDIPVYMDAYLRSDSTRFASGDNVYYGWKQVLNKYLQSYPDRETMGTLTFSDVEISLFSRNAALIFGRWKLTRKKDNPHGLFTLVLRKTEQGWKIIQDHTSSASK